MSIDDLPQGASVTEYPSGLTRARCRCDWAGNLRGDREEAAADARHHAATNAWCYLRQLRLEAEAEGRPA